MKRLLVVLASALGITCSNVLYANINETLGNDNLDEELSISAGGKDWEVWFTTSTNFYNTTPEDYMSDDNANAIPAYLNNTCNRQITDLGFRNHWVNDDPRFRVYCNDLDYWYPECGSGTRGAYNTYKIALDSHNLRTIYDETRQKLAGTLAHEMFHAIQYQYVDASGYSMGDDWWFDTVGDWVIEGTANCMDDRWVDYRDGAIDGSSHHAWARETLDATYVSLMSRTYDAGLFWSYCCEQLDNNMIEPERGYAFILTLWQSIEDEMASGGCSMLDASNDAISHYDSQRDFEDLFQDFCICNRLRELDLSLLSDAARYRYIDEQSPYDQGAGMYSGTVSRLGCAMPTYATDTAVRYSPRYYRSDNLSPQTYACKAVGFRIQSDAEIGAAVVAVDTNDRPFILDKGSGTDWARSFIVTEQCPVDTIIAVVSAYNDDAAYTYRFDSGSITNKIVVPTTVQRVYPGTFEEPGSFIVRLLVEGPSGLTPDGTQERSILGLVTENFKVEVGTNKADVLNSCYADAEYWLWVEAPEQLSNGVYDLTVSLCDHENHKTVATNAVHYGEFQVNHVVVIDHSGSMDDPPGNTKLDAAKDASQLYMAAVSDGDRIGFVQFNGNVVEPNDDAYSTPTNTILTANWFSRALFIMGIEAVTPSGLTSIGDGIWVAQQLLQNAPATNKIPINSILLLSDGLENEMRMWNSTNGVAPGVTLREYMSSTNTVISTVALGTDADQGLLQDMTDVTAGHYGYIGVNDTAGVAVVSWPNSLAEAFKDSLVHVKGLEQLTFDWGSISSNSSVTSTEQVYEASVDDGIFYFNWDKPGAITNIILYDPKTNIVDSAAATIVTGSTFCTYHMSNSVAPGTYKAVLQSGPDPQYVAGLLGRPSNKVHVVLALSHILTSDQQDLSANERLREHYQQGIPVDVVAMVTDRDGPVTGAVASMTVTLPTGQTACGPHQLMDDGKHSDGSALNGVYAARFTQTRLASMTGNDKDSAPGAIMARHEGTYRVSVTVKGTSNTGEPFERHVNAAFQVYKRPNWDFDADSIADTWEDYYGSTLSILSTADPDHDGLVNASEYVYGTDPFRADSDNGGETDGSEVAAGRCPHDPEDDLMKQPEDPVVVNRLTDLEGRRLLPNANLIRFPVRASYDTMTVERATNRAGPFAVITNMNLVTTPRRTFYDRGLANGVTYFYRMQAGNVAGSKSAYSAVFAGTAKAEPVPPSGWVTINNDVPKTDVTNVILRMRASTDVVAFVVSSRPISGGEPALPYTNKIPYAMKVSSAVPVTSIVYVVFIDAAGNISYQVQDEICYDPATAGTADDDSDGIPDAVEVNILGTYQFAADTDGDGLSDSNEVSVTHSLPLIPDTDNDGLKDAAEIAAGTSPTDPDSDDDSLPDGWEAKYSLDPLTDDAALDPDNDDLPNWEEFRFLRNPTNAFTRTNTIPDGLDCPPNRTMTPDPANGESGVSNGVYLTWVTNGCRAAGYVVLFGTSTNLADTNVYQAVSSNACGPIDVQYGFPYYWRVDATNPAGVATGHVWTFYTLVTRRPDLVWTSTPWATWYYVTIYRNGTNHYTKWLKQTSTVWKVDKDLPGGNYSWWTRPWSSTNGYGHWSTTGVFRVPVALPNMGVALSPSVVIATNRPLFSWAADAYATHYQLRLNRNGSSWLTAWAVGTTNYTPSTNLTLANYRWWVRGWDPDGFGAWSAPVDFAYGLARPIAPTGTVSGTRRPAFYWTQAPDTTWYCVRVNKGAAAFTQQWVRASATTITFAVDLPGTNYQWWIRTMNPSGYGPWSPATRFTVPFAKPDTTVTVSPLANTPGSAIPYVWQSDPNATHHELYITRNNVKWFDKWFLAGPGTGNLTNGVTGHTAGAVYKWFVRGYGPDGYGGWSAASVFTNQ